MLLKKYTTTQRHLSVPQPLTHKLTNQLNIALQPRATITLTPFIAHLQPQQHYQIQRIHRYSTAPQLSHITIQWLTTALAQLTILLSIVKETIKLTIVGHTFALNLF